MSADVALLVVNAAMVLSGLGVVALLGVARSAGELARRAALAPLAGIAWTGVVAATLATIGVEFGVGGLVALTASTCLLGLWRLRSTAAHHETPSRPRSGVAGRSIAVGAAVVLVVVGLVAAASLHVKPLVEYDGWAIWGMKARALAALGSADPAVFASEAYERLHLEYPLLLPSLHALPLQVVESFSSTVVVVQCLVIAVSGLLAVWETLRDLVRPALLVPVLAAIAAAPAVASQLGTGYADVPLAVIVMAGIASAARWLLGSATSWLLTATLFFCAASLTKNEGLLFVASAYVALIVAARGRRLAAVLSALVVAATYAPWRAFMAAHDLATPDYDLSSSVDPEWVLGRLDRAPKAFAELTRSATDPRQLGILLGLGLVACVLALVRAPPLGVFGIVFCGLSFAGLTWIYVITPYELSSYLDTNAHRVVVAPVLALAVLSPLLVERSVRSDARSSRPENDRGIVRHEQ